MRRKFLLVRPTAPESARGAGTQRRFWRWWTALALVLCSAWWIGCQGTGGGLFVAQTNAVPVYSLGGKLIGTNYVVTYTTNPGVTNALGAAQGVAEVFPWGKTVSWALGGVVTLLAGIAKRKSDQAAVVPALMAGLDKASNRDEVDTEIHRIATETGLTQKLNKTLHRHSVRQARQHFGR